MDIDECQCSDVKTATEPDYTDENMASAIIRRIISTPKAPLPVGPYK